MAEIPVITVDGPGGSGKGAVCAFLARWLGWHLLDSGALYRAVALAALRAGIDPGEAGRVAWVAAATRPEFRQADDGEMQLLLGGEDISQAIRSEECGSAASRIAAHPEVRRALLVQQRLHRRAPGLVADGRDMGTVVFPRAELKLYLTADPQERVRRRYKQLIEKGINVSLSRLSADIAERDHRDQERDISPLRPAADAVVIDTTTAGLEAVRRQVVELVRDRFAVDRPLPVE